MRAVGPIGAHVSIAKKLPLAIERAAKMGAECIQIFSSSPGQWSGPKHEQKLINKFIEQSKVKHISPIFIHAKYLVNLVSSQPWLVEQSIASLVSELVFAKKIRAAGVIVHLGSHQGLGYESVKRSLVQNVRRVLKKAPGNVSLVIENSAGQKGKLSSLINEMYDAVKRINSVRIGCCLDSCHLFAAGYDIRKKEEVDALINALLKMNLLSRIVVLHVNDAKDPLGSGRDRHENLGQGAIGALGLKTFITHQKLLHLPKIIETPGFNNQGPDKGNIDILRNLNQ